MPKHRKLKTAFVLAAALCASWAGASYAAGGVRPVGAAEAVLKQKAKKSDPKLEADYPPLKNQYYPTDNKDFQEASITNPSAHTRKLTFKGDPLDIFTKLDMVTQIALPSPPIAVNIGKSEAFTVEIIDALNSIFIKPLRQVELTNLIVNCENGAVYLFILKENPFQPWDMRCEISDPHRQIRKDNTQAIIKSLYTNRRMPEMQYTAMDLRTPDSTAYVYDPLSKTGCMITLKRAAAFPREGKSGYWVEFRNAAPQGASDGLLDMSSYSVSEKTVWGKRLTKVATPGTGEGSAASRLAPGDKVSMFLLFDEGAIPQMLNFRFAITGIRNLPVDVQLPTAHLGGKDDDKASKTAVKAKETVDERLQKEYERLVREGKIEPMTQEEVDAEYELQKQRAEEEAREQERLKAAEENKRRQESGQQSGVGLPAVKTTIGFPAP